MWGTDAGDDNIVWGTDAGDDNIVWGTDDGDDNIVWGTDCGGSDCDNIVWGTDDGDNIRRARPTPTSNIVLGHQHRRRTTSCGARTDSEDNIP